MGNFIVSCDLVGFRKDKGMMMIGCVEDECGENRDEGDRGLYNWTQVYSGGGEGYDPVPPYRRYQYLGPYLPWNSEMLQGWMKLQLTVDSVYFIKLWMRALQAVNG